MIFLDTSLGSKNPSKNRSRHRGPPQYSFSGVLLEYVAHNRKRNPNKVVLKNEESTARHSGSKSWMVAVIPVRRLLPRKRRDWHEHGCQVGSLRVHAGTPAPCYTATQPQPGEVGNAASADHLLQMATMPLQHKNHDCIGYSISLSSLLSILTVLMSHNKVCFSLFALLVTGDAPRYCGNFVGNWPPNGAIYAGHCGCLWSLQNKIPHLPSSMASHDCQSQNRSGPQRKPCRRAATNVEIWI